MARYTRRYTRRFANRDKYSIEHRAITVATEEQTADLYQSTVPIVLATTDEGMRKVKHITVNLTTSAAGVSTLYWAIVYVPNGYLTNPIRRKRNRLYTRTNIF